jgi:hypothetical protein
MNVQIRTETPKHAYIFLSNFSSDVFLSIFSMSHAVSLKFFDVAEGTNMVEVQVHVVRNINK